MQNSKLQLASPARAVPALPRRWGRRMAYGVQAFKDSATMPSPQRTAVKFTELGALQRLSKVLPDTPLDQVLLMGQEAQHEMASISRGGLGAILASPEGPRRYKTVIQQAIEQFYTPCCLLPGASKAACQVDQALVNVGSLLLDRGVGRVSTEVDPRVARDAAGIVERGRGLIQMYEEVGVPKDRVLLRIPATWEGIQAARQLEGEGITMHLVLVYSFVQGAAAAQAGVSVIQPDVGRLHDWYNRHPGYIRDPKGPLEESYFGKKSEVNPGLLLAERLYNYAKKYHPKTLVMASGLRTKQDALALCGCDALVVDPKVLDSLAQTYTLEGYNDGLYGWDRTHQDLEACLTPQRAQQAEFDDDELAPVTEKSFGYELGMVGKDLLFEGLWYLESESNRVEPVFMRIVGGQT